MEGGGGAAAVVNYNRIDNYKEQMNLPPGFRFHPTDEEIVTHYLTPKVINSNFSAVAVGEADLNKCEPWDLPKKAKTGEKESFFFCQRDRKYPTGMRTNRATESGYWKATGKDKEIYSKGKQQLVGMKKTLVFYKGRAPKGEKTNWVMHEFRLEGKFTCYNLPKSSSRQSSQNLQDEWVVCRVVHKNTSAAGTTNLRPNPMSTDLVRMNSFVESLLDSPSLPPLLDNSTPAPLFNDKQTTLAYTNFNSNHKSQVFNTNAMPYYQNNFPNNTFYYTNNYLPLQASTSQEQMHSVPVPPFHRGGIISSSSSVHDRGQCKAEQFSSNQSMVTRSQDTGVSTDVTNEISSTSEGDTKNGLIDGTSVGPLSDLDSFWSF